MQEVLFNNEVLARIFEVANTGIEHFISHFGYYHPEKKGGYLTITDLKAGKDDVLCILKIGLIPYIKLEKYLAFSQEKAKRLAANNNFGSGDCSSWQSRDPESNKWGGAIRAGRYILSFSGLPEHADEALVLHIAVQMGWLSSDAAKDIASISKNEFYEY